MTIDQAKAEMEKFVKLKTTLRPAFVDVILDIEPVKHGKWVFNPFTTGGLTNCKCSECGEEEFVIRTKPYKYCRWCGSQMDGEDHEAD